MPPTVRPERSEAESKGALITVSLMETAETAGCQEAPRHQTLPSPAAAAQARTLRRLGKNTTTTAARASTMAPMPITV